jgi:hypothetical protein
MAFMLVILIPSAIVMIDFLVYLFSGNHIIKGAFFRFAEIFIVVILPFAAVSSFDFGEKNDCCSDSAIFSPDHRITIYFLIGICVLAYFYLSYRSLLFSPLAEVMLNSILVMGIVLNIFIAIQFNDFILWFFGVCPIIILFIYGLIKNHHLWKTSDKNEKNNYISKTELFCWQVVNWKLFQKLPILLVACLPVLLVIVSFLMLFGQRPDSFILAFTDTYKHGLSQLDCTGVVCPNGHFLCTIAASGHSNLVKPIRKGIRQNCVIKVNRQLLISNAFEDMLQEKLPRLHKIVRRTYNLIGGNFAKLYSVLSNKWISDIIYIMMKPLECLFLMVLYVIDRNPENRIAKQYLFPDHRRSVDLVLKEVRV